jgi:hypothetical protein
MLSAQYDWGRRAVLLAEHLTPFGVDRTTQSNESLFASVRLSGAGSMQARPFSMFLAVLIAGLSACAPNPPPVDFLPMPAASAPGAAADAELSNSVVYFTVNPGQVFACAGRDRVASVVKWKINDPSVTTVNVQVNSIENPERRPFATQGAIGEAHTDNWVMAGVRFYLVDADSGKDLATYKVTSQPCR